jgi:S1-C subfamily serine protease
MLVSAALAVPACTSAESAPDVGWLGVSIADVNEELADRLASTFGPAAGNGVLVVEVLKDGPAERAMLQRGDVIVAVDAQPIWDVRQLQRKIRPLPVNRRVTLTLLRNATRIRMPVTIGPMPPEARAQLAGERFGFLVRGEEGREPRPAPGDGTGRVHVAFVDSDSPASRAGLQPLDVIREVNGRPVRSLADIDQAMGCSDRTVSLVIERRGAETPIRLILERPNR